MTLTRAVALFVLANIMLAWVGLAGLGGPTTVTAVAAAEEAPAVVPLHPLPYPFLVP